MDSFTIAKKTPARPLKEKRRRDLFRRNKSQRKELFKQRHLANGASGLLTRPDFLSFWPATEPVPIGLRRSARIKIPQDFSFLDNPEETLETLHDLIRWLRYDRLNTLEFDHRDCQNMDLCASAVLDVLLLQGIRNAKLRHRKIQLSGKLSRNDDVNVLLKVNGLLKAINHPRSKEIPGEMVDRLRIFPIRRGSKSPPDQSTETERASSELVAFFNSCLQREGYRLQKEKQGTLVDMIAELLVNAEDHSAFDVGRSGPQWYAIGYYKGSTIEGAGGECHIVLFNFGRSIFESLKSDDTSYLLKQEISKLVDAHQRAGHFDILVVLARKVFRKTVQFWQEDALWTVYALQEGVSRFLHTAGNEDRGNGTVRMIGFFTELAPNGPKMVLVSGRTWIKFDGTYSLGTIMKAGGARRIIAFNAANDLNQPPDPKFVNTMERGFPGTLVSLKFTLRSEDLATVTDGLEPNEDR